MATERVQWLDAATCELVVEESPGPLLFRRLARAAAALRGEADIAGATTGLRSLAVVLAVPAGDRAGVEARMQRALAAAGDGAAERVVRHHLPTRYRGPDLAVVAGHHGIAPEEVAQLHAATVYTVAAVGFMPHFAYLWGLPPVLATPRMASPRSRVPVGAVGIAGEQTGVYPRPSPGGWNLIGRVPPAACAVLLPRLAVGDEVVFEAVA